MDNNIIDTNKTNTNSYKLIFLFCLCPAIAVTTKLANSFILGLIVFLIIIILNIIISIFKKLIPDFLKIFFLISILAILVSITELIIDKYFHEIANNLGIYVPLIVTYCIIMNKIELYSFNNKFSKSFFESFKIGILFLIFLIIIGFIREMLGTCQLDFKIFNIFEPIKILSDNNVISIVLNKRSFDIYKGMNIFQMSSGVFILIGVFVAFLNFIRNHFSKR